MVDKLSVGHCLVSFLYGFLYENTFLVFYYLWFPQGSDSASIDFLVYIGGEGTMVIEVFFQIPEYLHSTSMYKKEELFSFMAEGKCGEASLYIFEYSFLCESLGKSVIEGFEKRKEGEYFLVWPVLFSRNESIFYAYQCVDITFSLDKSLYYTSRFWYILLFVPGGYFSEFACKKYDSWLVISYSLRVYDDWFTSKHARLWSEDNIPINQFESYIIDSKIRHDVHFAITWDRYIPYFFRSFELYLCYIVPCFDILESFCIRLKDPYPILIEDINILEIRSKYESCIFLRLTECIWSWYFIQDKPLFFISLCGHDSWDLPISSDDVKASIYTNFSYILLGFRKDTGFLGIAIYSRFMFIDLSCRPIRDIEISIKVIYHVTSFPSILSRYCNVCDFTIFSWSKYSFAFWECKKRTIFGDSEVFYFFSWWIACCLRKRLSRSIVGYGIRFSDKKKLLPILIKTKRRDICRVKCYDTFFLREIYRLDVVYLFFHRFDTKRKLGSFFYIEVFLSEFCEYRTGFADRLIEKFLISWYFLTFFYEIFCFQEFVFRILSRRCRCLKKRTNEIRNEEKEENNSKYEKSYHKSTPFLVEHFRYIFPYISIPVRFLYIFLEVIKLVDHDILLRYARPSLFRYDSLFYFFYTDYVSIIYPLSFEYFSHSILESITRELCYIHKGFVLYYATKISRWEKYGSSWGDCTSRNEFEIMVFTRIFLYRNNGSVMLEKDSSHRSECTDHDFSILLQSKKSVYMRPIFFAQMSQKMIVPFADIGEISFLIIVVPLCRWYRLEKIVFYDTEHVHLWGTYHIHDIHPFVWMKYMRSLKKRSSFRAGDVYLDMRVHLRKMIRNDSRECRAYLSRHRHHFLKYRFSLLFVSFPWFFVIGEIATR